MTQRVWPTREEWAAKAEYSVRTFCTMYERLPADAVFTTPDEDTEAQRLAQTLATAVRPLLNAEINRLKTLLPDRPKAGRARTNWFIELEGTRYDNACNLGSLEELRRDIARSAKAGAWGRIHWEISRINRSYPAINLCQLLNDLDALDATVTRAEDRRRTEAQRLEDEAVAHEMAKRNTDDGWAKELERRARVEAGPLVTYHPAN
ncbi:hypothetical protein [Kitasatospora camelliae]|uniref:Uncharacterized protein n=1 Tax=Kitasatospora camelliae TaxID=3156397 RepID=A0AAU8K474_9ACTN